MSAKTNYSGFQGLCSTCNNAGSCTFPRNHITLVWQCDEFDDSTPEKHAPNHKNKLTLAEKESQVSLTNAGQTKHKGLCVNCENRDTCMHTRSEGGVWHCEDYL